MWQGFGSDGGTAGTVAGATSDSGLFFFFGSNNWEIMVKVLDACGTGGGRNNHYWVFAAAATTLQYTMTVTDTETGAVRSYSNPLGVASPAITDTLAFDTCSLNLIDSSDPFQANAAAREGGAREGHGPSIAARAP